MSSESCQWENEKARMTTALVGAGGPGTLAHRGLRFDPALGEQGVGLWQAMLKVFVG